MASIVPLGGIQSEAYLPAPKVQWYGWDSLTKSWHGPDELQYTNGGSGRLLNALKRSSGRSWYGPVKCQSPGEPESRFFAVIHDLDDCSVAMIYCDDSKAGPAEIVVAIPAARRARLRAEFAFEFLAFTSFLRSTNEIDGMELHNRMTAALAETCDSDSVVFSITTGLWANDLDYVLSRCAEMVASAMLQWSGE